MVALRAIGLLALPVLVGHLFYRAFAPSREESSLSEVLFIQFLAGFLLCGWAALLLAELGLFSLLNLALLLLLGSAIVAVTRWPQVRRWHWPQPAALGRRGLLALAMFFGIAVLLVYPGEPILGGQDPGVYVAIGASIARSGGIVTHDPWISTLPEQAHSLILHYSIEQWWQLPGFYVTDFATGEITPQFLHLYPTWLALFYAAGGLEMALLATPLLMLLGLVALFFFARQALGEWVALVAVALLALNPALVWFAREPNAEALTLPLLFGGWYLFDRAMREPKRGDLAILAGLALGQIALTKLEFYILPVLLYLYFFLRCFIAPLRPNEKRFLIAHTLLVGHAVAHLLISYPYMYTLRASLENSRFLSFSTVLLLGLVGAIGVLALYLPRQPIGRLLGHLHPRRPLWRKGLALLWLLLVLYGGVIWPLLSPAQVYVQGEWLPEFNRLSFRRITWYLSPVGFVLAVLGLWWWLQHRLKGTSLPFLFTFLFQLWFYIHTTLADPFHFWMMRRYVPLIFPCMTIGIAVALWRIRMAPLGRTLRRGGVLLLLGLLLFQYVQADAPFASREEWAGTVETLERLAAQVPEHTPLFVEQLGPALATPLRYIYGREAYALPQSSSPEQAAASYWTDLWSLLQTWPPDVDTAYLLLDSPPLTLRGGMSLQQVNSFELDTLRTENSYDHLPRELDRIRSIQHLYRLQRRPDAPTSLEVSFVEPVWNNDTIAIILPSPTHSLHLQLQVAGFRPETLPPARLWIVWQGETVAEFSMRRSWEFEPIEFWLLPPAAPPGGEVRIEIHCTTWNPQEAGYGDDPRDLGIQVKSIRLDETISP